MTLVTTMAPPLTALGPVPSPRPPSDVAPAAAQVPREPGFAAHDEEYERLEPILARYAAMPKDNPARRRLRDQLVAGYLPVAQHIAQRYANRGEPLDDLVQVGALGLINAIDRYEPGLGHHFLGYAVPTITGEIRRHFRDKTWSMRVPRRLKELHLSINKVMDELSHRLQRAPRPSEIAARLGVETNDVLDALQAGQSYRADSLDELLNCDSDATLGELLGDTPPSLERFTDSHSLAPHLAELTMRERSILIMRFFDDMTQTQIAARVGVSQMHISRILTKTLAQLREQLDETQPAGCA